VRLGLLLAATGRLDVVCAVAIGMSSSTGVVSPSYWCGQVSTLDVALLGRRPQLLN
jgi:hypothetical protein